MINHAKLRGNNLQDGVPDSQSTVEEDKFEKAPTSQRMPITMIKQKRKGSGRTSPTPTIESSSTLKLKGLINLRP